MQFHVKTGHKLRVYLMRSEKTAQRFRMRLMQYVYNISYVPGHNLVAADVLSYSLLVRPLRAAESQFADEVSMQINLVIGRIPEQRSPDWRKLVQTSWRTKDGVK
jgi:hypothetical protein